MTTDSDAGRIRRLRTASSPTGVFQVLALDHRRVLLKMMGPDGHVSAEHVTQLKLDIAERIGSSATAIILDQQFALIQVITSRAVPAGVGFLVSINSEHGNDTSVLAMEVRRAQQLGASGVKLYLNYDHTGSKRVAQETLVRQVVETCHREGMPLFLEPILSTPDVGERLGVVERRRNSVMMVQRLGALGPDVLKLQFPVDPRLEPDETVWHSACVELDSASAVPWGLLSAGESFETFKRQLQVACESGSSGFIAGRSVWSEAATARNGDRGRILCDVILPRFHELASIATRYARGWHARAEASWES